MQEAPKRPQHLEMLEKANHTRTVRSEWRQYVRDGGDPLPVIHDNPEEFRTMYVATALKCIPWLGKARIDNLFRNAGILPIARLGRLTDRQRQELVLLLEERSARLGYEHALKARRDRG